MRILHTSDWHIGRSFHGHSTLEALRGVLETLARQVREHAVDVVIVAGDVFDSAAPAASCYPVLSDTLAALADAGAEVLVTSGNHDSAARLGFQSALLRPGIHVVTDPLTVGTPVTVTDASGPVHLYGIPYLEPAMVRGMWGEGVRSQAAALGHAMGLVRADAAERGGRSVAIAHCFAAGIEASPGVEREIRQGSLDVVPLSTFDGPDYVALGHIHGRQRLSERVRYAGAPMHYGFGEKDRVRGSWLVDLDAAGLATVEWLDLPVPRPLATLRAPLAELLDDPRFAVFAQHWVKAEYTDPTPALEPMRQLQRRFPWCALVAHTPAVGAVTASGYAAQVRAARSDVELVDAFLGHVRAGECASAAESALVQDAVAARSLAEALA